MRFKAFCVTLSSAFSLAFGLADGVTAEQPVVFVDDRALSVTFAELRARGALDVAVRNAGEIEQTATVRVVNLAAAGETDPVIGDLFDPKGVVETIPAGEERDMALVLRLAPRTAPKPGAYTGVLIASGERGLLDRRAVTISVTQESVPPLQGARLAADQLPDVTLVATNFLPSFLDPLGPALLVLAVIAALLVFAFWGSLRGALRVLVVGLVIALGVTAVGLDASGAYGVGARFVTARSIPVASDQSTGTVGVALTAQGDIAELNATTTELRVLALDHAGIYKGKVDLAQGVDGGEAAATVNVRDWWPWALLTLTLGVALGYRLRSYFEKRRPQLLSERDANREWQRISDADSNWQYTAHGKPYVTYTWIPLAQIWRAEIDRLLAADESKQASEQISALRTYAQGFEHMRSELVSLDAVAAELFELWNQHPFGINDRAQVDPLRLAGAVLDGGDEFGREKEVPAAPELLKQLRKDIDTQTELCAEVRRVLADVVSAEDAAHTLRDKRKDKAPAEAILTELAKIARQLLHAKATSEVVEAEKLLEAQEVKVEELANTSETADTPALEMLEELATGRFIDIGGRLAFRVNRNLGLEHPTPTVEIDCVRYSTTTSTAACQGDLDDLFALVARISGGGDRTSCRIEWDFDDQSEPLAQIVALTDGAGQGTARHQFALGGERTVRLRIDGKSVSSRRIQLSSAGIATETDARFALLDRQMTLLAGLIAVGSGMLAVYFSDDAWGQPNDYVQALLWGAVVAEGVRLSGALVSRLWPGT